MDVGAQVFQYFRQRYGPIAAAGIVGNTQQESSNNPNAPGGGLIQGQGGRTSSGSLQTQLHGIDAELHGPERSTLEALKGARGPRQAALIFSQRFERPGIPMNDKREQYAVEALKRYGNASGASASAVPPAMGGASSTTTTVSAPSTDQTAALGELLSKVQQLTAQPKPNLAAQASPSRPEAFAQPTLPAGAATPPPIMPKAKSSGNLLPLVEQVLASAAPSAETSTTPAAPAQLGTRAPATGSPADALTSRKGIVDFNGTKVAAWIAPILHYVQAHGVTPELSSGYRSKAEQTRIYDSGVRPAAVPGTSNHEGEQFPRGAVDIKNAQAVDKVLSSSPYSHLLVYAGEKDPVHFSHPHNGGY